MIRSSLIRLAVTNHVGLQRYPLLHTTPRSVHHCAVVLAPVNQGASERLFADAAREEAGGGDGAATSKEDNARKLIQLETRHQNWTGEESMKDAVLRMLVDKYKPLRFGSIRAADEKLKELPPQVRQPIVCVQATVTPARPWQEIAGTPLLPGIENHQPWHATFKAPTHTAASIKVGNFAPSSFRSPIGSDDSYERTKWAERELEKRKQQACRLSNARESILDYRLGLRGGGAGDGRASSRINPLNLKGWQSLIEDRIEKARLSGQFDDVKGRGQPIARLSEERNPFITREEFLMNRIVQRNGAAPPWIEIQMELEAAVNTFRETLSRSWVRRAIRTLTMIQPASSLPPLSLGAITSLRDREWEERERSYHDTAITELNSLVRKYNTVAPYAVRRPYYTRDAELAKAYHDCGEEILRGIHNRRQTCVPFEPGLPGFVDDGPRRVGTLLSLWNHILQSLRASSKRFAKAG